MIETICIPLLLLALAINIPTLIAYLIGLKFQIEDFSCKQEVKAVKNNILLTKIIQGINVALFIAIMVLLHL